VGKTRHQSEPRVKLFLVDVSALDQKTSQAPRIDPQQSRNPPSFVYPSFSPEETHDRR
jgi:hypothetical protein